MPGPVLAPAAGPTLRWLLLCPSCGLGCTTWGLAPVRCEPVAGRGVCGEVPGVSGVVVWANCGLDDREDGGAEPTLAGPESGCEPADV